MTDDPWYSSATAAMLIAMTALQRADGVAADVALQNAHHAWREHVNGRGNDTWPFSDLTALVARLTGG
jgi:hypothetical protein